MFAADTAFELFAYATSFEYSFADELTHAFDVEYLEGVLFEDAATEIFGQELRYVVT